MVNLVNTALVALLCATASARTCQNITVPVTISARNGVFNLATPVTNIDITNFALNSTQQGHNFTQQILLGYQTVSGTYSIAATYCTPDSGSKGVVQLLTHGIGFDRSYWDLPFNDYNYSYVEEAVDQYGYSTFTWDRLGIGQSQHGEPINEIQAWLEVSALHALTQKLRHGTIPGVPCRYGKIIHGGHSFGSEHTYALTAMYPHDSDGIFLTGWSPNKTFTSYFFLGSNFIQANSNPALADYPTGYLAAALPIGVQIDFFGPNDFDPAILTYAYTTGMPVTPGELLTIAGESAPPNQFAGPVLVITGQRDVPYCGGDCLETGNPLLSSIPAAARPKFVRARNFEAVVVPGSGHGLNLAYTHPFTYGTILNYFVHNGLAA